jgi:hypothetical protein
MKLYSPPLAGGDEGEGESCLVHPHSDSLPSGEKGNIGGSQSDERRFISNQQAKIENFAPGLDKISRMYKYTK